MISGIVADIKRASFEDGYGIRTTVFLKGCPLSCKWCHNPECIDFNPQMLFYPEKCIGCGKCDEGCYSGARVLCGKKMTADELTDEILLDKAYYANDGGVTFSGGEPLAQREFLNCCIDKCMEKGIGCAVETSLYYYQPEIFKKLDFIMADLKIWDCKIHKEYTGVGNERIIENFQKLNSLNVPILARTPVIYGINQQVDKISEFLLGLESVVKYELLPYHSLGNEKRKALGLPPDGFSELSGDYMEGMKKYAFIR